MAAKDTYRGKTLYSWYTDPEHPDLQRALAHVPGYVDTDTGPQSIGKHGMELEWLLRGPNGAVFFNLMTGWVPGEVGNEFKYRDNGSTRPTPHALYYPSSGRIGYHALSLQPDDEQWQGAAPTTKDCELAHREPGPCWSSVLGYGIADELMVEYVREGEQVIWDYLKKTYDELVWNQDVNRVTWKKEHADG